MLTTSRRAAAIKDIEAVAAALDLDRVILLGATVGGVRAIEYTARHPDRVAGLILYEAFPALRNVFPRDLLESISKLARSNWRFALRSVCDIAIRNLDEDEGMRWEELTYKSTTGELMARLIESQFELDVSGVLAQLECPTLVCHSRNDPLWPFEQGVLLAEGIPNARLVPLEGHEAGPFTNAQSAVDAIDAFLAELPAAPALVAASEPAAPAKPLTQRETEVLSPHRPGADEQGDLGETLIERPHSRPPHHQHLSENRRPRARGRHLLRPPSGTRQRVALRTVCHLADRSSHQVAQLLPCGASAARAMMFVRVGDRPGRGNAFGSPQHDSQ